eukprot:SAG11_NODE_1917_length_4070_cov_3.642156_2_plen_46_part_00
MIGAQRVFLEAPEVYGNSRFLAPIFTLCGFTPIESFFFIFFIYFF